VTDLSVCRDESVRLDLDGQGGRKFLRVLLKLVMHNYPQLVSGALQLLFRHFSQRQEVLQAFQQVISQSGLCCCRLLFCLLVTFVMVFILLPYMWHLPAWSYLYLKKYSGWVFVCRHYTYYKSNAIKSVSCICICSKRHQFSSFNES